MIADRRRRPEPARIAAVDGTGPRTSNSHGRSRQTRGKVPPSEGFCTRVRTRIGLGIMAQPCGLARRSAGDRSDRGIDGADAYGRAILVGSRLQSTHRTGGSRSSVRREIAARAAGSPEYQTGVSGSAGEGTQEAAQWLQARDRSVPMRSIGVVLFRPSLKTQRMTVRVDPRSGIRNPAARRAETLLVPVKTRVDDAMRWRRHLLKQRLEIAWSRAIRQQE